MEKVNNIIWSIGFVFVLPFFLVAQPKNNGFYGKKAILQLDFVGNTPVFNNLFMGDSKAYKADGSALTEGKDFINYGFRINAGYAFFRNFALLMEYGQEFSSLYPESYQFINPPNESPYEVRHEMVDVQTHFFIPKVELATPNALLPMGLSHQLGLGLSYSSVQEKDYRYQTVEYDPLTFQQVTVDRAYSDEDLDPIDLKTIRTVRKVILYYGLNVRTPISNSLLITYGLKYMLHFGKPESQFIIEEQGNERYTEMVEKVIARHRSLSIIHLSVGLSYVF